MTIRTILPGDGLTLTRLIASYRQEQGKEFGPAAQAGAERAFRELANAAADTDSTTGAGKTLVWVAADSQGIPHGYLNAHLGWFPLLGGPELYVSDLLVSSAQRGQGIGSALLNSAENYARAQGCVRIMLNNLKTDHSYERGYYVSRGYEERGHVANMVKSLV